MKTKRSSVRAARGLSDAFGLPRTAERIMTSLGNSGRYMSVKEIVRRVKMSERSVRKYLKVLVERGLLCRRAIARGRRVAYEYSLRSSRELLKATRREFAVTIERLEAIVVGLGRRRKARASSKSASSSRS